MSEDRAGEAILGAYLRDRRGRLDPVAFGFSSTRRRTPGLRREEVAQRANISPTWYTWLEQGRGGAPSADVLDRVARALMMTEAEREHLFRLGLGRPPDARTLPATGVSPRLQRLLDALPLCPAVVKTAAWDVVAWNRAAAHLMVDYASLPVAERNGLIQFFCNPEMRRVQLDWDTTARYLAAVFRADAARATDKARVEAVIEELRRRSPEFEAMWRDNDVRDSGDGVKQFAHPELGLIAFEYSLLGVDGRQDLTMMVHNPATPQDADKVRTLLARAGCV